MQSPTAFQVHRRAWDTQKELLDECLIPDKLGEFPYIFWQDMAQEFGVSQELCNRGNELTLRVIYTFKVKVKIAQS